MATGPLHGTPLVAASDACRSHSSVTVHLPSTSRWKLSALCNWCATGGSHTVLIVSCYEMGAGPLLVRPRGRPAAARPQRPCRGVWAEAAYPYAADGRARGRCAARMAMWGSKQKQEWGGKIHAQRRGVGGMGASSGSSVALTPGQGVVHIQRTERLEVFLSCRPLPLPLPHPGLCIIPISPPGQTPAVARDLTDQGGT